MANYFAQEGLATGNNDGTTLDDAYQSVAAAIAARAYTGADKLWIRGNRTTTLGANIIPSTSADGDALNWFHLVGRPKAALSFNATFTNGSTTVSIDSGLTADWHQHCGRKIRNDASGKWYIITHVDSGNFIIDREYAGTTASNGACTIEADEHYAEFVAIDDSAWTIKIADWLADDDDPPVIDAAATDYYLRLNDNYMWRMVGINFRNGNGGTVNAYSVSNCAFKLCLFEQTRNSYGVYGLTDQARFFFEQCIFYGNSTGTSQTSMYAVRGSTYFLKNCAIYNMGGYGISGAGIADLKLDNVNIGVEVANDYGPFEVGPNDWQWKDVKYTGTVSEGLYYKGCVSIENDQKVLGAHKAYYTNGTISMVPVVAESGDPEKRSGGADTVIAVTGNQSTYSRTKLFRDGMLEITNPKSPILVYATGGVSQTYTMYVQANALAITDATEFFLDAEYVDVYDDTSEYHYTHLQSAQTIAARSGADDWSQYISVTVNPAVTGFIRFRLFAGFYDADGTLYIDPLMVVS